jgi:hypothetical protein
MSIPTRRTLLSLWAVAGAALVYRRRLRPWILTWGATPEEAAEHLPGDELLEDADGVATRAITIDAPPPAVWPWIAQMGPSPRGGAYTYDWIENLLGLNMHSSDRVLPEFQHPRVGEGFGYGANRMSFAIVDPEHVLATRSADGNWVWTFVLEERGDGETRLLSRNRFRLPRLRDRIGMIPMEPGSLVMERKMLLGIKQRAEAAQTARSVSRAERHRLRNVAAPSVAAPSALYGLGRMGRRSGVTPREAAEALPGDEIVADPMWQSTRAITIAAPPEQVWPWIVQMGFPSHRAGWYTPHWLDRLTFGIKQRRADRIVPELQQLTVGDRVPDSDDWWVFFTVEKVEPPHGLVLHSTRHVIKPIKTVDFSWAFIIRALPQGRSRLLIRARTSYAPRWALPFVELVIAPADFVNAGAMLRGIKQRVETAKVWPVPREADENARLADAGEPRLAESERGVVSR